MVRGEFGSGEDQFASRFLPRRGWLARGKAGPAELAEGLVARQHEQQGQGALRARSQSAGAAEIADEPCELAAPVAALAVDQALGGWIDRRDAVDLAQHRVLRCPEADRVRDRLIERNLWIRIDDEVAQLAQRRVLAEGLADRVDQVEARAEMLVERRAGDPGALRHLLHRRLVEGSFGEEVANGGGDPCACRLGPPGASAAAVGLR